MGTRRIEIKHANGFGFGFSLIWGIFFGAVTLGCFLLMLAALFGQDLLKQFGK